ncbi:hypothetical protein AB4Y90_00600 [Chryseobacterium sp. 2TAF14]|uniref:hypothetical protein n=1 Tax=Chryseobacterium sp. 2TAF14 TaxID=3233007 RepID=UPI003F905F7C
MLHYPSNLQREVSEKISKNFYIAGALITFSILCFSGGKQIIKLDFKNTLAHNKIISVEINGIFFSQDDLKDVFTNFQDTEGRYRCDHFPGYINLENNEIIPIEVIRHCYEKNRYIIISKKYYLDADIGDITTDKFEYIHNN